MFRGCARRRGYISKQDKLGVNFLAGETDNTHIIITYPIMMTVVIRALTAGEICMY